MPSEKAALLTLLGAIALVFAVYWARSLRRSGVPRPGPLELAVGAVTDFFDTLGIGSFATTTAAYGLSRRFDDRLIPGTLNVGHALPTVAQAFIYVTIVRVEASTLVVMIGAAVLGAALGSRIVVRWRRERVQLAMGTALLVATALMTASILGALPKGGESLELPGAQLLAGALGNFVLGALMCAGIGLYAPCMILVSFLGMSPAAAFPIMMGSCAFLMPVGGVEFIEKGSYDPKAALGLAIGGIPGVLVAALVVRSLPLGALRILVVVVAAYAGLALLRAGWRSRRLEA